MENKESLRTIGFNEFDMAVTQKPQVTAGISLAESGELLSRKLLYSLESGMSPLLPNEEGVVKAKPIWNIRTGVICRNITLLALLERQAELKSTSNAFVTWEAIQSARRKGVNTSVKGGEQGLDITLSDAQQKLYTQRWLNLSQLTNGDALLHYYNKQPMIDEKPYAAVQCTATNHIDYLAQVLAAITTNNPIKVNESQKDGFIHSTIEDLSQKRKNGEPNRLAIYHMMNKVQKRIVPYIDAINEIAAVRQKMNQKIGKSRETIGVDR